MAEIIIFLIISLALFSSLFVKNLRKRNKKELLFLVLNVFFILLFVVYYILTKSYSNIIRFMSYTISIIIPIILVILNYYDYNFKEGLVVLSVNTVLLFGNRQLAKKLIFKFLKNRPHSFALHKKLGDIYKEEGGIRKAIGEYIVALNLKQVPFLYLEVAEMFYDLDNKDEAKEALLFIISREPNFLEAYLFLSKIYLESEQYKEAAKSLNDALKCYEGKGDYDIYYQLGEIHAKLNEFKESRSNFEKANEIVEKEIIRLYIAQLYLIENEEDKAIKAFKELLDVDILKPYVLYELAKVAKYRGEKDKAISYINEAIKYDDKIKDRALSEDMFYDIRTELILSVKLDDDEIEIVKEKLIDQKADKTIRKNILKNLKAHRKKTNILESFKLIEREKITDQEIEIIKHFSSIFSTINDMGDVTAKQKTKERVDKIFKENLKFSSIDEDLTNTDDFNVNKEEAVEVNTEEIIKKIEVIEEIEKATLNKFD